MAKFRILYTEDDETIAFLTKDSLEPYYDVVHCTDGLSALKKMKNEHFDICLFDIMMPKMDGFELAAQIRRMNTDIPILFISAKAMKEDRIKGLKTGADDYIVKPFSMEELILKIEIFLKRSQKKQEIRAIYQIGQYEFDCSNYTLKSKNKTVTLTRRESELLKFLIDNKNTVLKREEILIAVWGENDYFMGRSLDVFISRLRKIFVSDNGISIDNLHGIGFKFSIHS